MSRRIVITLVLLTVLVLTGLLAMRPTSDTSESVEGEPLFPDLLQQTNEVGRVVITRHDDTTTLEQIDRSWVVVENDRYPAAVEKIRELIIGLARLTRVEGKTDDPELYSKLWLEDVGRPQSRATLIQVYDDSDQSLAELLVGKTRAGQGSAGRRQYYVRANGEPRSWLVAGRLPDSSTEWMDTEVFNADIGRIESVSLSQQENSWVVTRSDAEDDTFVMADLAADESLESKYAVEEIARSLSNLSFDEIRPAIDSDNGDGFAVITARWFNGLQVELDVHRRDSVYAAKLSAGYQPLGAPDPTIASIAERWNTLWADREFVFPDIQMDNIIVSREQLTTVAEKTSD